MYFSTKSIFILTSFFVGRMEMLASQWAIAVKDRLNLVRIAKMHHMGSLEDGAKWENLYSSL